MCCVTCCRRCTTRTARKTHVQHLQEDLQCTLVTLTQTQERYATNRMHDIFNFFIDSKGIFAHSSVLPIAPQPNQSAQFRALGCARRCRVCVKKEEQKIKVVAPILCSSSLPKEGAASDCRYSESKQVDQISDVRIFHVVILCGLCGCTIASFVNKLLRDPHIPLIFTHLFIPCYMPLSQPPSPQVVTRRASNTI